MVEYASEFLTLFLFMRYLGFGELVMEGVGVGVGFDGLYGS